jgi:hypothetical protein
VRKTINQSTLNLTEKLDLWTVFPKPFPKLTRFWKRLNLLGIIVVLTIICLTQASCFIEFDNSNENSNKDSKPYLKVVNKYNLPITTVHIEFIENVSSYSGYSFADLNIPKDKSKTFPLEPYNKPYNAEVTVYFGDMYSYKELRFDKGVTTTATLNVNGILE